MNHHRCPNCGRHVGWSRLFRGAWLWTRWRCPGCQMFVKANSGRRTVCSLISFACIILWSIPTIVWDLSPWWFLPVALTQVPIDIAIEGVQLARDDWSAGS